MSAAHDLDWYELSGERPVKAECLPFARIPHTTRLFLDFISADPAVQQFFPRTSHFQSWFKDEAKALHYDAARRERVSAALDRQNRAWGASAKTLENIARLRNGASAVVTGQQVGLFGGPLFAIYKALTAVKLAAEAQAGGVDCVPVFWLATTDHDLAEVNHISIPGADGSLQRLETTSHAAAEAPVSSVVLGREIEPVAARAVELLGDSEATLWLREAYRPGETLGSAFGKLFAKLFAEWGVVLLDAADPELHKIAAPVYRAAIERAAELDEALLARGKELERSGYHQQVKVTSATTLLFMLRDGARTVVHRRTNGRPGEDVFSAASDKYSQKELTARIENAPEQFSANVLLRPVVQDYLLPTLAYVGGAAEVAYFAQAGVVYEKLAGKVTPVLPRFSATLVESKMQRLLEKYGLELSDLFQGPDALREAIGARTLPQALQTAFQTAETRLEKSLQEISVELKRLDPTLVEAGTRAASKMKYQMNRLRSRAARAEARRNEIIGRHALELSQILYPDRGLQEREVAGIYFASRYGSDLMHQLYEAMQTDCHDHQVITL
jgi:bacillithiol biosynthesis cysteine-adding enzyme BshC